MLRDVYLMHRETGEIVPSNQVFKEFYKTHGIYDSVFTEWIETDIEVENGDFVDFPDFKKVVTAW